MLEVTLRDQVQRHYGERVTRNEGCCAPPIGGMEVPSFGCGAPTEFADLEPGETVLDLGSGAGLDCFRAAEKVGETGRVVGVDMTPAMLARARQGAAQLGLAQVEFREGYIEALPVETESIDVVISNCVVNLSTDKDAVLAETYRVLKPGGRVAFSDTVRAAVHADQAERMTEAGWCACEDGAEDAERYRARLTKAGFIGVAVSDDGPPEGVYSARVEAAKPLVRAAEMDSGGDSAAVRELLTASGLPLAGLEHTRLWVLEMDALVGVAGFERYGIFALFRSLAVVPEARGRGIAAALLRHLLTLLKTDGVTEVYGLTTTIPNWLLRLGFEETTKDAFPPELARSEQLRGACPGSARAFRKVL